jgi:ABC-type transporter Mla subunit MlaD
VSEPELLVEIAREEEALHLKTEDTISRLREARQKLEKTAEEVRAAGAEQLPTLAQRSQEVLDGIEKSRDVIQEVFNDYSRILRELELNRVSAKLVQKVRGEICMPLESALKSDFVLTSESLDAYRKELEATKKPTADQTQQAKDRLDRLIEKLNQVMSAMGEVTTINKLIATLREIEKGQDQSIGPRLKELQRLQREKLLEKLKGASGDGKSP